MVDAGGGNRILEILKEKQIKINKIHYLFVNHSHTEHILGVIEMVRLEIEFYFKR